MKNQHILLLNEQAAHFFEASKSSNKTKEKLAFAELGRGLLKESREILQSSRKDSVLVYFEFMFILKKKPDFPSYLEFCARIGLDLISNEDYSSLSAQLTQS